MNLIITFDYELFGNGSGDVFKHMIEPTTSILSICDKYNIKTTIFFEVVEYWSLKKEWENGNSMGYSQNPAEAIKKQLQDAFKNGHDIQLHFHPQWLGAEFTEKGWKLNLNNWKLSDFSPVEGIDQTQLLERGIKTMKEIFNPIDHKYEPTIIRAGGYNIMPSSEITKSMEKTKLFIDSSVYPGGIENGDYSQYNYEHVSLQMDYWFANPNDITLPSENKSNILEIPLFALPVKRWRKFNLVRIKSILINKKSALESIQAKTSKSNFFDKVKYWFKDEAITWDFCLFDNKMHNYFFNYIEKHLLGKRNTFVLVGHPKNFNSKKEFEKFIQTGLKNYSFITLENYARSIFKNLKNNV
jgi:hypothetical protein